MWSSEADDVEIVHAARAGDPTAFGALFDRWFDRVFDVSYRIVRDREVAAEVAQDVFLTAWQQIGTLRQPESFGGWLLRMSRNRSLNRLERERRSVALGDEETAAVIDRRTTVSDSSTAVEQAENVDLVWAAAAALGERDASVLDLHLRHGLGPAEIAEALDVTPNNAHQLLFRLKGRLAGAIRAWVLWSDGAPSCPGLATVLATAGIERFGPEAVKVIGRHADACDACEERRTLRLSPETMFAAVPIVVAGPLLRAEAAAALADAGVPMDGSTALPGPGGADGTLRGDGDARRARRHLHLAMAVVAGVLVLGAVVAVADSVGDGTGQLAAPVVDTTIATTPPASPTTAAPEPTTTVTPTSAPTTAPPAVTTTVPTTAPTTVPTAQPVEVPPPPPPPPPDPPPPDPSTPDLPEIERFFARVRGMGSGGCPESFHRPVDLIWASDADEASLTGLGAPSGPLDPSGTTTICLTPDLLPVTYVLTVEGPGGTATDTAIAE